MTCIAQKVVLGRNEAALRLFLIAVLTFCMLFRKNVQLGIQNDALKCPSGWYTDIVTELRSELNTGKWSVSKELSQWIRKRVSRSLIMTIVFGSSIAGFGAVDCVMAICQRQKYMKNGKLEFEDVVMTHDLFNLAIQCMDTKSSVSESNTIPANANSIGPQSVTMNNNSINPSISDLDQILKAGKWWQELVKSEDPRGDKNDILNAIRKAVVSSADGGNNAFPILKPKVLDQVVSIIYWYFHRRVENPPPTFFISKSFRKQEKWTQHTWQVILRAVIIISHELTLTVPSLQPLIPVNLRSGKAKKHDNKRMSHLKHQFLILGLNFWILGLDVKMKHLRSTWSGLRKMGIPDLQKVNKSKHRRHYPQKCLSNHS